MAELADALDSGSSEFTLMQVQVLLSAPRLEQSSLCSSFFLSYGVKNPKNTFGEERNHRFVRKKTVSVPYVGMDTVFCLRFILPHGLDVRRDRRKCSLPAAVPTAA